MSYHQKGPVAGRATEPDEFEKLLEQPKPLNKPSGSEHQEQLQSELTAARQHLEHRAEANAIIAQWRDELRVRITRSQLRHELIGLSTEEHDQLVNEVGEYKRLCRALSWSPAGRRRG